MTDDTAHLILEHLTVLRNELRDFKREIREAFQDVKHRLSSLEQQVTGLRMDFAHYNLRQDQSARQDQHEMAATSATDAATSASDAVSLSPEQVNHLFRLLETYPRDE